MQPRSTTDKHHNPELMKKLLIILVLLATIAFGAPIRDAVVAKILAAKARKLITPDLIKKVIETRTPNFGSQSADFFEAYHMVRLRTYEDLFADESHNSANADAVGVRYIQLRTLTVAVMKGQLHTGNTLANVYADCREAFVKTLGDQDPIFVSNLSTLIQSAISEFESVKIDGDRSKLVKEIESERQSLYGISTSEIEEMLAANAPAEKIAERIAVTVVIEKSANPRNLDMAKFALRRWKEGGKVLCDKYLVVLRLAAADLAKIAKNNK
jgi:hypothetical protein